MLSESGEPSVLLALQRVTHHTLQALTTALADLELTASEITVLANLADGGTRNVREISVAIGTRATTLTGVLDRLDRRGYLTRQVDPADRRSFRVALTRSGRTAATRVRRAVKEIEEAALIGLSTRQVAGFHAVIAALQERS